MNVTQDVKVLSITKRPSFSATGQAGQMYVVRFSVGGQTEDVVEVPEAEFTADRARQLIHEKAATLLDVLAIT